MYHINSTWESYQELELLSLRLKEYDDFVDKFHLFECDLSYQYVPKPLFYQSSNMNHSKIVHHKCGDDLIQHEDLYENDRAQRMEQIVRSLNLDARDIVIYSDVDKILFLGHDPKTCT